MMVVAQQVRPTFIYPKSRQFPFDEVCEQIVRALEERNWDVPGISVEFDTYGSGDEKYRMVRHIKGDGFKLWFCRTQGRLNYRLNDTAAVTEVVIPEKELHVYEEESGPTLYVYVGKNWAKDKDRFLSGSKTQSKQRKEPRWYLKYSGSCNCGDGISGKQTSHTHHGSRSPLLVHDNDLGREYEPRKGEPKQYRTWDVLNEFTQWLKENLLAKILEQPAAEEKIDVFAEESSTPFPAHFGPIFCFGENQDAQRTSKGKQDPSELEPSDRYALMGSGYRLLSLGTSSDGSVPRIAYKGFLWAGFGEVSGDTVIDTVEVSGHNRWPDRERFLFRVMPNRADDIYVADHAPYEQLRKELCDKIEANEPKRKRLTDAEVDEFSCARARTIIPISDYDGSFEQPIVLINRELDFDEVELVSGPWPEYQYVQQLIRRGPEVSKLFERAILAHQERYLDYRDKTKEAAYINALVQLVAPFVRDAEIAEAVEAYGKEIFRCPKLSEFMERLVAAGREMQDLGLLQFGE